MIRVGIWFDRPVEYSGGLNYVRNLLHAVQAANRGRVRISLFVGDQIDAKLEAELAKLADIVRTPVLNRYGAWWFLDRLLVRLAGSHRLVARELKKHGISILSHAAHVADPGPAFKVVSWYPDFQFLHLPELFPGLDVQAEIRRIRASAARADAIIVSSHAALEDLRALAPAECAGRTRVLQFVSQPTAESPGPGSPPDVGRKYAIKGRYFHLPNQFWQHKNHWTVLKAVAELKRHGVDVTVVCTGNLVDYRLPKSDHVDSLRRFIAENGLEENVLILGLIPYADVLKLMRGSIAVINPSRFEGWSSTVEEAKSMGKKLLISDIPVHREQDPPGAAFFAADDVQALGALLLKCWNHPEHDDGRAAQSARQDLAARTLAFGESYIQLLEELSETGPKSC